MPKIISAQEHELLSFFEVQPKGLDDTPWPYNDFLYEINQNDLFLSCAIAPAYRSAKLVLKKADQKLLELIYSDIEDIRYQKEEGAESLIFVVSEGLTLILKLKPQIQILSSFSGIDCA